jgi:hypothetical protein
MTGSGERALQSGERQIADLSSLLVELSRVLRGLGFYPEGDRRRTQLLDGAFLAYRAQLERAGSLEVWVDADQFRATGIDQGLPHGRAGDVAEALRQHGVERFRFDAAITRDAFHAFAELMERDAPGLANEGGFAEALAARSNRGIRINGAEPIAEAQPAAPVDAAASLGSALLARTARLIPVRTDATEDEKPDIDADPLAAPAGDPDARRQRDRLNELDRAVDDDAYRFLGERIAESARTLFEAGQPDECYRAILVFSSHAVGEGERSGLQARRAQRLCAQIATGAALQDLIERARQTEGPSSVHATQVLLQLGDRGVAPLLDRLGEEQTHEGAGQLTAILIVLGDVVVPHLEQRIRHSPGAHANLAVRLAGELQNPALSPVLAEVMRGTSSVQRRDAARALAQIGGEDAISALINALSSRLPELPATAAHCLGVTGQRRATAPLLAALDRSTRQHQIPLCREIIRALGQLREERAVPKLVALVERRRWLKRGPVRELKLTSLSALDRLPGREAQRAIERAAKNRDPQIRRRADELLDARAVREQRRADSVTQSDGSLHSEA